MNVFDKESPASEMEIERTQCPIGWEGKALFTGRIEHEHSKQKKNKNWTHGSAVLNCSPESIDMHPAPPPNP